MDFLITENQLKLIIENKEGESIKDNLKQLNSLSKKIFSSLKQSYGIDFKLLLTWGTAVGGLIAPLDQFIQSGEFDLTDQQRFLILGGIAATLFFDNERYFGEIYDKIKEEGLEKVFKKTLNKGYDLKNSFLEFLGSLSLSVKNVGSLVRYSFLIPIITDIQNLVSNFSNINEAALAITKRILASGVVTVSAELLSELIKKILRRISK
jgi:hypothetical protein